MVQPELKQSYKQKEYDRLLLLQISITDKISRTTDEHLIKLYLQQANKIVQQRLAISQESTR